MTSPEKVAFRMGNLLVQGNLGWWNTIWVVVSNILYFLPVFGGKIPSLTNIIGMGWNYQLAIIWLDVYIPGSFR